MLPWAGGSRFLVCGREKTRQRAVIAKCLRLKSQNRSAKLGFALLFCIAGQERQGIYIMPPVFSSAARACAMTSL